MKVVSSWDDRAKRICQNPELASSFVNTFAPAGRPSVWATDGKSCFSPMTLSLSFVRSTHIRILCVSFSSPSTLEETTLGLATTTMPAQQSVGVSTRLITLRYSILCSSRLTTSIKWIDMRRGIDNPNRTSSSRN